MDPTAAVDAILDARSSGEAAALFRENADNPEFATTYFQRIIVAFGVNPAEAARLAGHWKLLLAHAGNPALAYRAKAVADRLEGRWLDSAKAFVRAGAMAESELDRLTYPIGAVDSFARAGRIAEAISLGRRLARSLDSLNERALAGRVRLNVGNALLWQDRYRESRRWLGEAVEALTGTQFENEAIYAQLGLSTAELYGGRPSESHRLAVQARDSAIQAGLDHVVVLAEINVAQSALQQGRADQALQELLRIRPLLQDSPHDLGRTLEFVGVCYLRLNLWREAADAFGEALTLSRNLPLLNVADCTLGAGRAELANGDRTEAIKLLKKAQRAFAAAGNEVWASSAETWLARAYREDGALARSQRLAAKAASRARSGGSPWHEVAALLESAEADVGLGRDSAPALRRADLLIRRHGYRSLAWRIPAIRARIAPAGGKLRAYRHAFEAILESRLLTSSPIARTAYLRDKSEVVSHYLAELLSRPTAVRVREAVEVVSKSRSAALIDEILTAGSDRLSARDLQQLDALRDELHALESEGQRGGGSRRATESRAGLASVQRRWIEANHRLVAAAAVPAAGAGSAILANAGECLFAIDGMNAKALPASLAEVARSLRWNRFEILAPMADRDAEPKEAMESARNLARYLLEPWMPIDTETLAICPEDHLWQVPWTVCVAALQSTCEPVLALHPALTKLADFAALQPSRTVLWINPADDLYHASGEETSFLEKFPNATVCRTAAEARASLEGEVDLLHVIGHAKHNPENPMFSSVVFCDGALYAAEIARSSLRAKFVTLSACETGSVSTAFKNEPDGLARAFLARGAQTVVGSLWPLDDEAASRFYDRFYSELKQGSSIAAAMRKARQSVREWRCHPYFWGSPVLFGGYS